MRSLLWGFGSRHRNALLRGRWSLPVLLAVSLTFVTILSAPLCLLSAWMDASIHSTVRVDGAWIHDANPTFGEAVTDTCLLLGTLYLMWVPSLFLLHWDLVGKRGVAGRLWHAAAGFGIPFVLIFSIPSALPGCALYSSAFGGDLSPWTGVGLLRRMPFLLRLGIAAAIFITTGVLLVVLGIRNNVRHMRRLLASR